MTESKRSNVHELQVVHLFCEFPKAHAFPQMRQQLNQPRTDRAVIYRAFRFISEHGSLVVRARLKNRCIAVLLLL